MSKTCKKRMGAHVSFRSLWFIRAAVTLAALSFSLSSLAAETTPLHVAAAQGNKTEVETLLKKGANVNATDENRWTPLHWAADVGHVETAKALLAGKADPNAKSGSGATPLHRAAFQGHAAMVRLLLAAKADPNAKDSRGKTPLQWAEVQGHKEAAAALGKPTKK